MLVARHKKGCLAATRLLQDGMVGVKEDEFLNAFSIVINTAKTINAIDINSNTIEDHMD